MISISFLQVKLHMQCWQLLLNLIKQAVLSSLLNVTVQFAGNAYSRRLYSYHKILVSIIAINWRQTVPSFEEEIKSESKYFQIKFDRNSPNRPRVRVFSSLRNTVPNLRITTIQHDVDICVIYCKRKLYIPKRKLFARYKTLFSTR